MIPFLVIDLSFHSETEISNNLKFMLAFLELVSHNVIFMLLQRREKESGCNVGLIRAIVAIDVLFTSSLIVGTRISMSFTCCGVAETREGEERGNGFDTSRVSCYLAIVVLFTSKHLICSTKQAASIPFQYLNSNVNV